MNKVIVVLGAATLAFGSASAYLYNDLRDTRAESASLKVRVADLETAAKAPLPAVEQDAPPIPVNPFTSADAAPTPPPSRAQVAKPAPVRAAAVPFAGMIGATASAGPVIAFGGGWEQSQKMLADPEYRDAMKRQQKLMMPRVHPDLQEVLQLDQKQADELFDLLAEHQVRGMTDSRPPFFNRESPPDEATMRAWSEKQQQMQSAKDAEIATLLGDAGYQQWKSYNSTMPARAELRELRFTLESAGVPLEREQSEKLVAVVSAEQQKAMSPTSSWTVAAPGLFTRVTPEPVGQASRQLRPSDRTAFLEQQIERTKSHQQQMRAAISPHLSSRQMEQFDRLQASQLEMQEIQLKMMRAQAAAEARGDVPPNQDAAMGSFTLGR